MKRLGLLTAAALLAVPLIQACGEDPLPPPPTGSIAGQVSVEGDGADGITVTLSSGETATTASGGMFRFDDVEAGTYTVTISNFPDDASFPQASAPATLADDGEVVTVNFSGVWIRTSAILGAVTVEGSGLSGVIVRITGMSESETTTGTTGQYGFTGLRAGNYTVEISGFDDEEVGFGSTSATVQVSVGESKVTSFEGTYLRASAVQGRVSVEGKGLESVTVSLQGRGENLSVETNGAGQFMFEDLRKGDYAVAISGYDDDEYGFEVTSKSVSVAYGETASVPFEGTALRTAGIRGRVTVEGRPLDGVTVTLSGREDRSVVTTATGRYVFDRLHAGGYAIDISGYDTDEHGFPDGTSENVTVALKETATVEFDGIMLRTAAIEGEVTVKGDALPGVTVTVAGGPKDDKYTATTNGAGVYEVGDLHAGDYSVTISGYDTDEYGFEVTTKSVSVGLRETAEVAFDGILLRTAGVSGRVSVDGEAMSGLAVTLAGEEDRSGTTNADGQYAFSGLAAGDYTLTLSGYDTDEYEFDAMEEIELALDEAAIHNFEGRSLRTVVVMGTVSAEGDGIEDVGVTLIKVLGATSGEVLGAMMTGEDGGYMFDELLAGTYRIELGETDDEYDFATKSRMGSVATDETAMWDFDADIIRTASVGGMVTVDGEGMGDVMVMLTGDHGTDEEMGTGSDGTYEFDGLRKGSYMVSIENPDEDTYDFPTTSRSVRLSVGQEQDDVSFAGSMLRRASISGQVHVEGEGLEGVTVRLRGDERDEAETDGNGEYNFPGLAGGDYEVSIENPDEDAYTFEVMEVDVDDLGEDEAEIVDFEGEHTATASVSGVLFADEVTVDSMHTEGEPMLAFDSFPLILQGPGVNDSRPGATDSTGAYSFDGLKAGQYNVVVNMDAKVTAALARAGYAFSGDVLYLGIDVPAATDVDVNLPFRITKQTIGVGAVMGNAKETGQAVAGVNLSLYATAKDADAERNSLRSATTGKDGRAKIEFDREDDGDHLVYAKVNRTGHADLVVSDNNIIEIQYEAVDRETEAPAAVRLLNTRANFQWWVKSDEDAEDGNEFLKGWKSTAATGAGVTGRDGKATFSGRLAASALPKKYTVALDEDQADSVDMKEIWAQSRSLAHTHTGLEHPDSNKASMNDLGVIRVTWRTQALVVGVYREADDVEGYTDYQSKLPGGDHRPVSSVARDMSIKLLERDGRNRLVPYKYNHDRCTNPRGHGKTDDREASVSISDGLARVACLPAGDEFTIRVDLNKNPDRDDRVMVGVAEDELHGDIEAFNEDDLSVGGSVLGIFGDAGGGVPEVRICLASEGTDDDECATWGYQWKTGTVTGNVGNQSGHLVKLKARTDNHGADSATARSGANGVYRKAGLRDGEYDITAYGTTKYKVTDDPPTKLVYVYHDETTDDKDTATKYVGTAGVDTAKWSTRRLGLKLMGYIGNDRNGSKTLRGNETVEGITVELTRSGFDKVTTRTDDRGFYKFENLEAGSYRITPKSGSTYTVNRGYSSTKLPYGYWFATAGEYPALTEGEPDLPRWSSVPSRRLSYSRVRVCNDATPQLCNYLYNFGLLYTDGVVEGRVNTLSGSANSIDLRVTDVFTGRETEVEANFRGEFTRTRLTEGDYRAEIADAGWAVPRMRGTVPDDDGTTPGATRITGEVRENKSTADMGVLHVYSTRASDQDRVRRTIPVYGRRQGESAATYNRPDTFDAAWSRAAGTGSTVNAARIGTISWQSKSVRFYFGFRNSYLSSDAGVEVKVGSKVCASHTCELGFNATGSANEGQDRETTLTVMVTAENGYNDHEYSVRVARAAPVGNDLPVERVKRYNSRTGEDDDYTVAGTGALTDPFLVQPASGSYAYVRFALEVLGSQRSKNQHCAQSVMVEDHAGEEVDARADGDDDVCSGTRYRLQRRSSDSESSYTVNVNSEDGRAKEYHLAVVRPGHAGDARLRSLSLSPRGALDPDFDSDHKSYDAEVNNDTSEVTVRALPLNSDAEVEITPADADADAAGHQVDLDVGENDITIEVTSEDETDTETYTVTVTRKAPPASDDATLKSLVPDEGKLAPAFDPETEDYTLGVEYDVEEVGFTFAPSSSEASMDRTSPHTLELGDAGSSTDFEVTVTAEDDETEKTYTVTVNRAEAPAEDDATLKSLVPGEGRLAPAFDPGTEEYTVDVGHGVGEVEFTFAPASNEATTDRTSPDTLDLGKAGSSTDFEVTVTAEDGETEKTYTVTVRRARVPAEVRLDSLKLDPGTLTPAFDYNTLDYTASVGRQAARTTVRAVPRDDGATVVIEPRDVDDQEDGHQVYLRVGETEITATVTESGEEAVYTVTVTRPAAGTDATLKSLAEDASGTLSPAFASATTAYALDAAHDDAEVVFTFATTDDNASASPASPHTASLGAAGSETEVEITVTAEDGDTEKTYTVTVSRASAPVAGIVLKDKDDNDIETLSVEENDTVDYEVSLATKPDMTGTITVTLAASPSDSVSLLDTLDAALASLDFDSTNWDEAQIVRVVAVRDADAEPNTPVKIAHTTGDVDDDDYDDLGDTLEVTIPEIDNKGVVLSATAVEVAEGRGRFYSMRLTSAPRGAETVTISVEGAPTSVTVNPSTLSFGTTNWADTQLVTVTPDDDTEENEPDETFNLTHDAAGGGYNAVDPGDVSVVVMDVDGDESAAVVIGTTEVTLAKDSSFTYFIALTQAPDDDETVTVTVVYNSRNFSVTDNGEVALTATNFADGLSLTVTAKRAGTFTLVHDVASADVDGEDAVYDDVSSASSIGVTVNDNN